MARLRVIAILICLGAEVESYIVATRLSRERIGRLARKALKRKQAAMEHGFDSRVISHFDVLVMRRQTRRSYILTSQLIACSMVPRDLQERLAKVPTLSLFPTYVHMIP